MKTNKNTEKKVSNLKFGLEKFEIAKLKNLHMITGGDSDDDKDGITNTKTSKMCNINSGRNCIPN